MQEYVKSEYIQDVLDVFMKNKQNASWFYISKHVEIKWEVILNNPELPWDWCGFSCNPNITIEIIKENLDKPFDWQYISENKAITLEIIVNNPELPWDWDFATFNPNITWKIITENPDKPWNFRSISYCNKSIRCQNIIVNPDKDLIIMSQNSNITLQIIEDNPDKPWDLLYFSKNQNIFKCTPTKNVIKSISKWHAANVIKRRWFKCITDPAYMICRKRLMREFEKI